MCKADCKHNLTCLVVPDDDVSHQSCILANVVEFKFVSYGIFLYEKTYLVGRLGLQTAVPDIQNFIEESSDMESESESLFISKALRIFRVKYPSLVGKSKLQLVPVILCLLRRKNR
ncbi:unknown [Bacteroides sp. CAG:770]|nr:unknown [Bacteroides sp. CAG:770]